MKRKPLTFAAPLNLKAAAEGQRRFAIAAYSGGTLPVNGFEYPVVVDLSALVVPVDQTIPLLLNHTINTDSTLGQTDSIVNSGADVSIAGPITGLSPQCQRVLAMSDAGQTWQASIGLLVDEQEVIAPGQVVTVNGQSFTGPIIVARRATLRETSVLPMGADATTSVNLAAAAAQLEGATMGTFEEWIAKLGINAATLSETDKAALLLAYDAAQNPPTPPAPPVVANGMTPEDKMTANGMTPPEDKVMANGMTPEDPAKVAAKAKIDLVAAMRTAAAAENRRQLEINTLCVKHPLIGAKAIEANWDVPTTKIAVLEAQLKNQHTAPAGHIKSSAPASGRVLEAALCQSRKIRDIEKQFTPQELEMAHTQFHSRIGLQQMVLQAAASNGYVCSPGQAVSMSNVHEVFGFAFQNPNGPRRLEASMFSTVSLPGIFSNTANKEILDGYLEEDQTWREIAVVKSSKDLKAITAYRMLDSFEYEPLGPAGEIRHGDIGEESYTRQAKLYAKMFSLTLESILNDDLSALDDIKARLGRGSMKKMNKVLWTAFLDDAAFFTAARGNLITGATTTLLTDLVGLQAAVTAFDALKTPLVKDGGKFVGGELAGGQPEILLHPPQLSTAADTIYKNTNLGTVKNADANIYQGKYRPVKCKFLSDSTITGNSATGWYLLRGKSGLQPMVVTFLDGQEAPTVQSAEADFNTLGVQFRGWHGFGCDKSEYLSGIKSKGAA